MQPPTGLDGPSLLGLVVGGAVAWVLVFGFAVWYGADDASPTGRRVAVVAALGGASAVPLAVAALGLSAGFAAVSGITVPVWVSLWVVAGPLGLLLTLAYHERVGGDPAVWLGIGALAGFAVWPVLEWLAVLVVVTVL